jgi:2-dehydropantoate 2-reductase
MRLVILGAGAVGGVVGGLLARAKREVVLLARGAHLAVMREHGLRVETPEDSFTVQPPVAERITEWRDDDVVLLAVKTQDAASALRKLAAPRHIPIVCLTNGVEAERIALRHAREVYGACVIVPATHLVPGLVQVWSTPPGLIDLGRYPDGQGSRADEIAGELIVAGLSVEVRANVMRWKRAKLLSNLGNGAEALCGPAARTSELDGRARAEARACFAAAGLSCASESEVVARRVGFVVKPIEGAARSGGSTWQSLARGASTLETDYLNGEIAMLGRQHGVPTPINEALQRIAAEAARAGIEPGSMTLDELAARVLG